MLRYLIVLLPFIASVVFIQCNESGAAENKHEQVKQLYSQKLSAFSVATDSLVHAIESTDTLHWKDAFKHARMAYKEIELLADYYFPGTAKAINGPPVKEVEPDDPVKEIAPTGFQVMEESLFPEVDPASKDELLQQAKILQSLAKRLQNGLETLDLTDSHVFDALRLQLLRIITIGLAGADNGIAQNSVAEAAVSLRSFKNYLSFYTPSDSLSKKIDDGITYIAQNNSFNEFDRGEFIIQFIRPLWNSLYKLQQQCNIPFISETGLVNTRSPQLLDASFFNAYSFLERGAGDTVNQSEIELGRKLFSEKRLSGTGARSCASCHSPQKAYTDGLAKNVSIDGKQTILRNTPTILYASLQPVQFADGRLSFLEDQAKAVIENHSEMKGDLKKIVQQLSNDTSYQRLAQNAFGKKNIIETDIIKSLAVFIRSQAPFNSPFDNYLRGNRNAISDEAKKGFTLFMGKAKCGTCHFNPLFNGVVPPHFSKMESEIIGVPAKNKAPFVIDGDEGKYGFTQAAIHRFAFKTPTLRNIALTAPYMHNGVYQILEEVIDFYDKGGGAGIGIALSNQTLPPDPLNLTNEEKKAIIAFLQALSDQQ